MAKEIKYEKGQAGMIAGLNKVADAVKVTLGPKGKCVAIQTGFGTPDITRDGATVAKAVELKDPVENMGAQLIKAAARKTEDVAGDGPQPLYAKVLTPTGWTTMGELKIGDRICGTNSTIQEVTGIFHKGQKEIYKVCFAQGKTVECCEDHLWTVFKNGKEQTLTLKEIIKSGIVKENPNGTLQYKYYTPKTAVEFEEKDLVVDPYLVGLLIGDGSLTSNGSIELSLGKKKIGVLDSITLPSNIQMKVTYYEDKNYYRVKFTMVDKSGKSMHEYMDEIGLLNTKSSTKFIPKNYLYNSLENRTKLLSGLVATDGYLTSKGLIEYSTISKQLSEDIVELMNSLGYTVHTHVHTRENDPNSYSDTPIYRITQLVGYKYGDKLIGIEKTGKMTEMQCIKVSNPDELYITDGYIVTHNTSSTTTLTQELVQRGMKYNHQYSNINEVKSGMDKTVAWVTDYIKSIAVPVEDDLEKIRRVATISANNDPAIGDLIVECMEKVGTNGVIVADKTSGLETTIEVVEGFKVGRGWASPHFVTSPSDATCVMENPLILVAGEKISSVPQIMGVVEASMKAGQPLLIVCDDMDEVVMTTIVVNVLQGALRCCVIKGIDFGDSRKNIMNDIAVAVGARFICPEFNLKTSDANLDFLGSAQRVVVSKDSCVIYQGYGDPEAVTERLDVLRKRLEDNTLTDYEKHKLESRVSCLSGGIGIIKAGGASDTEKDNRKATIDDAILASKSAITEGVVPGGGYVFLKASEKGRTEFIEANRETLTEDEVIGAEIVLSSLPIIVKTIGENSGIQGDVLVERLKENKTDNYGYNAKTGKFCDLFEAGVLDSAKVLRVSLENAVSTAALCLLTNCVISEEVEEKTCECKK